MRVKEISLRNRFLAIFVLAFALIAILVFLIAKYEIQNFILNQEKTEFQSDVQGLAKDEFDLSLPISLRSNTKIPDFAEKIANDTKASDVKVLDSSGQVIYSAANAELGQDLSKQNEVRNALQGDTQAQSPNYAIARFYIYVPIESSEGTVRGIVIANARLDQGLSFVNRFAFEIDAITCAVLAAFGASIYFAFANAEDDLTQKDRSLVDQSRAYQEEKQLDDAIMASMAESLVVINKDGQIMLFNPEAERLTGFAASEVEYRLYRKVLEFFDKDGKAVSKNPVTEALKTGKPVQISIKDRYFLKSKEKELLPISVSAAPIMGNKETTQGVAVTIQDISAEKELEKVKDEFVYVVAHELGNPIFALDGYLSILEDQEKQAKRETKEMITTARAINQQLSGLVNDLLEVVRNEQGTLKCDLVPVDLTEVIGTVMQNAQFKAKDKKISLGFNKSKLPKVKSDLQKVKEVVTNLVDNAIKYTPACGKVEVWQECSEGKVVTHIKDNGYGISKEAQEKLFEKFYRVRTKDTAEITGTGLGLFICRQIVEKCGGEIWVESEEGKGSTFSFALNSVK